MIKDGKSKVFEDDLSIAFFIDSPSPLGRIILIPKNHFPIIEQSSDSLISHLMVLANKLSTAMFDSLNIQGTNILINNGLSAGQKHSHFSINIIPRVEKDGVGLEWKPKQLSEEEMATSELKLKEYTTHIGVSEEKKGEIIIPNKSEVFEDSENYLVKHLRRIP
jgi:histidine triad (HIT) family protein